MGSRSQHFRYPSWERDGYLRFKAILNSLSSISFVDLVTEGSNTSSILHLRLLPRNVSLTKCSLNEYSHFNCVNCKRCSSFDNFTMFKNVQKSRIYPSYLMFGDSPDLDFGSYLEEWRVVGNSLTIEALAIFWNSSAGTVGRWLKHGLVTSPFAQGN